MLRWCSFCQKFLGEAEPYEDLRITHGICPACQRRLRALTDEDLERSRRLQTILDQLIAAGRSGDLEATDLLVRNALAENLRAIDILMGLVAPALYQIGEDWRKGFITVAEEHRFTTHCEQIFEFLRNELNAPGNRHTLAIRILAAWCASNGIAARITDQNLAIEDLITLVAESRPRLLLISIALSEQHPAVVRLVERIATLPGPRHPKILVGGYAVKMKLVPPIPGAHLEPDINSIETSLFNEHRSLELPSAL